MSEELTQTDERPEWLKDYQGDVAAGTEDLSQQDLALPFLAIGQSMHEMVQSQEVPQGCIFCPGTGEIFAEQGEKLILFPAYMWKTYIKWGERGDDNAFQEIQPPGGEAEESVKRGEKIERANGQVDFLWTLYMNYAVYIQPSGQDIYPEWFVLSCFRSNIRAARRFNTMIKRQQPIFSRQYSVETKITKNKKGSFFTYQFNNVGYVTDPILALRLQKLNEEVSLLKDSISVVEQPTEEVAEETGAF